MRHGIDYLYGFDPLTDDAHIWIYRNGCRYHDVISWRDADILWGFERRFDRAAFGRAIRKHYDRLKLV